MKLLIKILIVMLILGVTGCEPRDGTIEPTNSPIFTVDGTSACKAALGRVAMDVVPFMPEETKVDQAERFNSMLHHMDELGSFPAECDNFTLQQMEPWMGYAGTLVWFCDTIDPDAFVDTSQDLMGRTLEEWLLEYLIVCPIPN